MHVTDSYGKDNAIYISAAQLQTTKFQKPCAPNPMLPIRASQKATALPGLAYEQPVFQSWRQ